jgi:hypothetical protein
MEEWLEAMTSPSRAIWYSAWLILLCLFFLLWRRSRYVLPKPRLTFNRLYSVVSQKTQRHSHRCENLESNIALKELGSRSWSWIGKGSEGDSNVIWKYYCDSHLDKISLGNIKRWRGWYLNLIPPECKVRAFTETPVCSAMLKNVNACSDDWVLYAVTEKGDRKATFSTSGY